MALYSERVAQKLQQQVFVVFDYISVPFLSGDSCSTICF